MARKPPVVDPTYDHLSVHPPENWAVGLPAIIHSLVPAVEEMGVGRATKLLTSMNQKDGFDYINSATIPRNTSMRMLLN